ncbi:GTP-binding protein [Nocardioides jensenii]|uniref:GTP-binding protein n=1 Tax=Nocardioides jensenii TaxID=1843 RepID=UPI000835B7A4|nr:GTP-binding protein [Nocardioides jensenii]
MRSFPSRQLPVVLLAGLTRTSMETVESAVALTLPDAALARFEIDVIGGAVTRVVSDATGVVERDTVPLDHTCLSCALRHEIVPTLARLAESGRWGTLVLSLPAGCHASALVHGLPSLLARRPRLRMAAVVAALHGPSLLEDLCGDDLLRERDDEAHAGDTRAVGEVLVDLLDCADLVVLDGATERTGRALIDELRAPDVGVVPDPTELTSGELLATRAARASYPEPAPAWLPARVSDDGVTDCTSPAAEAAGVWTVMVDSWRPFHPPRLMESIDSIGGHSYLGRGTFWLPTHPDCPALWAGSGGQLSIGSSDHRPTRGPRTRLVITGCDQRRNQVIRDLEAALMTEAELAAGLARWAGVDDGFDPWLGTRSASA